MVISRRSGSEKLVASSPIKAFVLRKVWSWVGSRHPQLYGFSEVGVAENLLFPGGVVGPGHGRRVELLCSHFCTNVQYKHLDLRVVSSYANCLLELFLMGSRFKVERIMNLDCAERTGRLSCPSLRSEALK